MTILEDHPLRYSLVNELHARPFPRIEAPSRAVFLTIKREADAAKRDRADDVAHLVDLLDRHGATHPQPNSNHYYGQIGRHYLKWESHTEFVTYTVLIAGVHERPFDAADFDVFPEDWLAKAPGKRMTSAIVQVMPWSDEETFQRDIKDWFVSESVACSRVLDGNIAIAGDFRIDPAGHLRFAVAVDPETDALRVGRVVQRLCEIETYKTMSMLGFAHVRKMAPEMGALEDRLSQLTQSLAGSVELPDVTLEKLLTATAELEGLVARSSFRLSATMAYERIVAQRIEVLREARLEGQQSFAEFMMRRYDPAMRTVASAKQRLEAMSVRANRTAQLLRTRVDVERSAQNQALLSSIDRRSDTQLRLQKTVEGLSVVAISYYAVSLGAYALYPLGERWDISKGVLTSIITIPIILMVWLIILRIRKAMV